MSENENLPPRKPDSKPDTSTPRPESDDSIVDFGVTDSVREGASGVVPLADLPDPQSSPSLVSWTEVIRQHRESGQRPAGDKSAAPVKIDAVSDKDLLARISEEEQRPPARSERDTDKLGKVPLVRRVDESDSSVDMEGKKDESQPSSGSAVRFDLRDTTADAGGVMPSPWEEAMIPEAALAADAGEGDIPMAEALPFEAGDDELAIAAEPAGPGASGSAISFEGGTKDADDIMEMPSGTSNVAGRSSILDMLVSSDPDVQTAPSDVADLGRSAKSSEVDWAEQAAEPEINELPDSRPVLSLDSSADESVDLYAEGPVSRGISDSGALDVSDAEIEEASRRQKLTESSAIDLSSHPSSSMFEMEIEDAAREGAVDMSLPASDDSAGQSSLLPRDQMEEFESPAPRGRKSRTDDSVPHQTRHPAVANEPSAEYEAAPSRPTKAPRQQAPAAPRKKGGLLVGAFLGILLAAGGIGAAWYLKQLPDPDSVFGDGTAKNDNQGNANQPGGGDAAAAKKEAEDAKKAADDAKKTADDMVASLTKQLKDAGIDEEKPEDGLKKALTAKAEAETKAQEAATNLLTVEAELKLVRDKVQPKKDQKISEAIQALVDARVKAETDQKTAELAVEAAARQLKDAGIDDPKLEDGLKKAIAAKTDAELKLKNAVAALDKAGVKDPDFAKQISLLIAAKDASDATAKGVRERLEKAKIIAADADQVALLKAIDDAITRGSSDAVTKLAAEKKAAEDRATKLNDDLAKAKKEADAILAKTKKEADAILAKAKDDLAAQKTMYEAKLTDVRTPAQLIDVWLPALADKDKPANTAAAIADADIVLKNAASTDVDKAKALAVKALALRNQSKLTEARAAFADARKHPGFAKDQDWAKFVASAADTLDNPAAFVGIARTVTTPTTQQLLERVDGGLKLFEGEKFAKDRARLIAQRSQLKFEAGDLAGAAADAQEAVKSGAGADGQLALARVLEAQSKYAEAEAAYRAVLRVQAQDTPQYRQASLGLARVLLQKSKPAATSMLDPDDVRAQLALLLILLADPAGAVSPEIQEALDLADALIAQKEYLGYIIKADALAKLGRFNAALTAYSTGIKALKVLPKEYEGVLDRILARHPAMQQPDVNVQVDPSRSLKHYAQGLEFYRGKQFAKAEDEFVAAVRNWNQDARYMYYLGLSRWMQGKKVVADADFKAGALLEMKGRPLPPVITEAFERVQGSPRAAVEALRP